MSSTSIPSTGKAKRALVADDDPFYREIAAASLVDAGYDVVTAADGNEAIEVIDATSPDIAIVDVLMPGLTGVEIINTVRSNGTHRHLPFIVITGQDDTESIQRAYDAGATSFLAKPLNWPLFVQHVNFVLKASQAESDLRDAIRTAEFLSDLKGRVVSVLISEFQSPLRTAQGMSELLRKEVYGPLGQRIYLEYAEDLHKALEQLNSIQLKMMNSSRVMSGELLLKEEDIKLKDVVADCVQAMRSRADRRGIDIDYRDGLPGSLSFRGDRSLITQAIKMLVEGAVLAAPRNSAIYVDARVDQDGGLSLVIEDGAPALPEVIVRDILGTAPPARPMIQQQQTTSRNTGLTISRVVVEAHEGKMTIRSTMGEGTLIKLALPKSRVALAIASSAEGAVPAITTAAAGAGGLDTRPSVTGVPLMLT